MCLLRLWQDPKRKAECEALFGGELPGNDFDRLVDLGKRITDFAPSTAVPDEPVAGDALDEDIGVAVEFEGEDEEEDSEGDEVVVRSHSWPVRRRPADLWAQWRHSGDTSSGQRVCSLCCLAGCCRDSC